MLDYLHPVTGGIAVIAVIYAGVLGLRARSDLRQRPRLASVHSRLAPWAYGLAAASWVAGLASTLWGRSDLEAAATFHFRLGVALVLLLSGSAWTAKRFSRGGTDIRHLHAWLGAAALLVAAGHAVAGLQITP